MTSTPDTPPVAPTPTPTAQAAPAASSAAQSGPAPVHWSRGAISGAGRLLTTAANDETVRSLISARARNNLATGLFGGTLMGAIAARVATRSVPGALLVGGALLAKAIYDQRKAKADADKAGTPEI
ncbi:hypothetical protein [Blastomonas sp. AAP53]|uniref:hypothetical protein n=1 Tax=Blastomonas sp. AAP53 TaxID=1248760 RepID=UPI0002F088C3|nr:hypothetical protein [Blastomonas sp. AAP53]